MAKKLVGYAFLTLASDIRTTGVRCMDASVHLFFSAGNQQQSTIRLNPVVNLKILLSLQSASRTINIILNIRSVSSSQAFEFKLFTITFIHFSYINRVVAALLLIEFVIRFPLH